MGLDISIRRLRRKHFEDNTPQEVFNHPNSSFCVEYRNLWKWMGTFQLKEKEDKDGIAYRFLTNRHQCNVESDCWNERINDFIGGMDLEKFVYVVEFDF